MPTYGTSHATKLDGPTFIYLLRLEDAGALLPGSPANEPFLKLGLSNNVVRRVVELNAGFPPALGLSWTAVNTWLCPDGAAAWEVERTALLACHAKGYSAGGEFVTCAPDDAMAVVNVAMARA